MRIYLDMDGVLVRCHEAALEYFGVREPDPWPDWHSVLQVIIGAGAADDDVASMTREQFWSIFDENWWVKLYKTPLCDQLITACAKFVGPENVFIATRPTRNPGCWSGKYTWVLENLPRGLAGQVIQIQGGKDALARVGAILIDDSIHNIVSFNDAGGLGILVPRPWNGKQHNDEIVLQQLQYVVAHTMGRVRR